MTLSEKLLPKLSEWRPAGAGRHSLTVAAADAGWTVHLTADRTDTLSCQVWELTLDRTGPAPAGLTVRAWAGAAAARATGLLEPLELIEADDARGEAVLRSRAPARHGDRVAYYEVRLTGLDRATVRRFTALRPRSGQPAQSGRDQMAFVLTHEVLAKLVGDIAG